MRSSSRRASSASPSEPLRARQCRPIAEAWARALKRIGPPLDGSPHGERIRERRERSAASFADFFELLWPSLEPSTPLVRGRALDAILEHLDAVGRGEITRLLVNVPPGFSKSVATSVFLPAWIWGPLGQPGKRFISFAHESGLAVRDNLRGRNLILSEEYQEAWGRSFEFAGDQNAKTLYENTRGGWRFATSVGSAVTGRRGDFLLVDDPHSTKSAESDVQRRATLRWFAETLPTRLNDQRTSTIVVIMQRLHTNDVAGHILKSELGYEVLCIPMEYEPDHPVRSTRWRDWRTEVGELADPVRFTREAVDSLKRSFRSQGGDFAVAGQLQQRPIPRGGGLFKEEWFKFLDRAPSPEQIAVGPVRGWDLGGSEDGDHTVGVKGCVLRTGETVILDVRRAQLEPSGVYALLRSTAEADGNRIVHSIPQDPGQAGKDQKRHIAAELRGHQVFFSPESGSKEVRAAPLASQAAAGNLRLVRAEWNDAFISEACEFPRGAWDDQVDAASRMFARLLVRTTGDELSAGASGFRVRGTDLG